MLLNAQPFKDSHGLEFTSAQILITELRKYHTDNLEANINSQDYRLNPPVPNQYTHVNHNLSFSAKVFVSEAARLAGSLPLNLRDIHGVETFVVELDQAHVYTLDELYTMATTYVQTTVLPPMEIPA